MLAMTQKIILTNLLPVTVMKCGLVETKADEERSAVTTATSAATSVGVSLELSDSIAVN